jgi:hypothetical protein
MLEEEYMQDAADKEWMQQYEKPNRELDNRLDTHFFPDVLENTPSVGRFHEKNQKDERAGKK